MENEYNFEDMWFNNYAPTLEGKVFNGFTLLIEPMNGAIILQKEVGDDVHYLCASPFWDYDMGDSEIPAVNFHYCINWDVKKRFDVPHPYPTNEDEAQEFIKFYLELLEKTTKEYLT